jgi:hypothetical protein
MMSVYFVPLGGGRFEPYFEHEDHDEPAVDASSGFFSRMTARFSEMLRDAERARHERLQEPATGFLSRVQRRLMRWIAERVAEQRLLWKLRRVETASLYIPADHDPADAERRFRQGLQRDGDRHLRLLVGHAIGLALAAPMALVPGPNLLGYFFTFTVVSHFLSFRGARRGTSRVQWTLVPSDALAELGRALTAAAHDRHQRIHEIAAELRLPRLAVFVERMAVPSA